MKMARIGVYIDDGATERMQRHGANAFQLYIEELLAHAGIPYTRFGSADQIVNADYDVIVASVTGGAAAEEKLYGFAERGGIVVSFAGLPYLAAKLGCKQLAEVPVGYGLPQEGPWAGRALRLFRGRPWSAQEAAADAVCRMDGAVHAGRPDGDSAGPLLHTFRVGTGVVLRWAADIPSVIVRLQQGELPVFEDGIPAPDGTGAVDEGILKADDQCQLDWETDRVLSEDGEPYYGHPYADYWRETMLHCLLAEAAEAGLAVPFVDYWPEGVEAVAMISHDSDHNIDETAESTLDALAEAGVRSTWCMIEPGYSASLYPKIKEAGHELALHYNALDSQGGLWSEAEFHRQCAWFQSATGLPRAVSNKNHYTRTEGWGELFRWCEAAGIESDQTRGPSKRGNVGFPFAASHPYFPIAWSDEKNRLYNVLEIGFLTQDLTHPMMTGLSVLDPFLSRVMEVRGVAHFLYHQVHIHERAAVRQALLDTVREARQRGFVFWTGAEINEWVRARRKRRIAGLAADGRLLVEGEALPIAAYRPLLAGETADATVVRFGLPCVRVEAEFTGA